MKYKIILSSFLMLICSHSFSQCKVLNISGRIQDANGQPLAGISVNPSSKKVTYSDNHGLFKVEVCKDSALVFSMVGFKTIKIIITGNENLAVVMPESELKDVDVSMPISQSSYWSGANVGASLGVNLKNNPNGGSENIVGSATVIINPVKHKYFGADWAIVGNIGNYLSGKSKDDIGKDLAKIAQDNNGLYIGMGGVWELKAGVDKELAFRMFVNSGYRLNSFQNIGVDSVSVSLNQWRNSFGLEFEGFEFINNGKMQLGAGVNLGYFSAETYEKIFGSSRKYALSFDTSVILPISGNFGFMFLSTYSKQFKPVHQAGIIIKNTKIK